MFYTSYNLYCLYRLCLNDYIIILSMYVLLVYVLYVKPHWETNICLFQEFEKGVKTYSPPSRYTLSDLTTFVYFQGGSLRQGLLERELVSVGRQWRQAKGGAVWGVILVPRGRVTLRKLFLGSLQDSHLVVLYFDLQLFINLDLLEGPSVGFLVGFGLVFVERSP